MPLQLARRFRRPLSCAVVVLAALNCLALPGQSSEDATATGLSVRSATDNAAANAVVVELANDTQKSVTAYGLDITVTADGKTIAHTGYGADLLNLSPQPRSRKGTSREVVAAGFRPILTIHNVAYPRGACRRVGLHFANLHVGRDGQLITIDDHPHCQAIHLRHRPTQDLRPCGLGSFRFGSENGLSPTSVLSL